MTSSTLIWLKRHTPVLLVLFIIIIFVLLGVSTRAQIKSTPTPVHSILGGVVQNETALRPTESLTAVQMGFEVDHRQSPQSAVVSRGNGYKLSLHGGGAALRLQYLVAETNRAEEEPVHSLGRRKPTVRTEDLLNLELVGARADIQPQPQELLSGKSNYLIGADQTKWRTGLDNFGRIKYAGVYPGIDILYYGQQGQLEYDLAIAPKADPSTIKLKFSGVSSAEIAENGDLSLTLPGGRIGQSKPLCYQADRDGRIYVPCEYIALADNTFGFKLGDYDHSLPLVIDPILAYSTYLNFYATSVNGGLAIDAAGNKYVTGSDGDVVYVAKLNAAGTAFVYTTHIGGESGNGGDAGSAIAVDGNGNVFVSGDAFTGDFPTVNAYQPVKASEPINVADSFLFKLDPTGTNLLFSTFLGGSGDEANFGLALNPAGDVYVAGLTEPDSFPEPIAFPVHSAYQSTPAGGTDGYLAKFSSSGAIAFATLVGGNSDDYALDLVVDSTGNAYLTGQTYSSDFPTVAPLQASNSGAGDAFISKFSSDGSTLSYSSYLGGGAEDLAWGIALDQSSNIFLTGFTRSSNFPTAAPFQAASGSAAGGRDVFVTKLNSSGSSLVYSTYLGGSAAEEAADIKVDATGAAYVVGFTASSNFPLANPLQTSNNNSVDAFVTKFNADGATLGYSTFLGGSAGFGGGPGTGSPDYATAVVLDNSGNAYIFGETYSTNFPLVTPLQSSMTDYRGAFLTQLNEGGNQTFYTITGYIESNVGNRLAGVTVNLTGTQTGTMVTDAIGVYTFNGLAAGGTYTVTPTSIVTDPASQTFANLSANQTANFMRAPRTYHIGGRVTDGQGNGIPNVVLDIAGYIYPIERYTDQNGNYLLTYLEANRTYTVTPRHASYSFAPIDRSFVLNANQLTTDFTGINNQGLSVDLTAPVNGGTYSAPATVTLNATAASINSSVAKVDFFANGTLVGTDATSPYSVDWTSVSGGQYVVRALVTDALGATKASNTANIIVNSVNGPAVTLTSPVNNATLYSGRYLTLSADASTANGSIVKVEFFEGATRLGQDTSGPPYQFSYYLYAGTYDLTAVATDSAGGVTRSAPVHLNVVNNQPPVATITSPANNSVFDVGVSVPVSATASDPDGSVASVKFFVGSDLIGTDTTPPYTATWDSARAGIHAVIAMVTDDQGGISYSDPVDIQVGNRAPSVVILTPTSQSQFSAPANITFSAQGFDPDGTVTQVEFFANGTLVGTDTTAPYSIQWTNVAAGNYDLATKVTDDDGATAYSQFVFIRVFAEVPTVAITSPAPGATFAAPATIPIEVTATTANPENPISYVAFYSGGQNLGFDSTAPYSLNWSNVSAGTYTLTVVATDSHFAETTSAPLTIEVTGNIGTWQLQVPQIIGAASDALQDVDMVSATEGWAVGTAGSIFHTTNGGVSWDLQHSDSNRPLNAVSFFDSQRGIAIGNAPFYTTNGGDTWLPGAGMIGSFYGLDFVDATTAFASGGGGITMKTTDGGAELDPAAQSDIHQ